MIEAMPLLDNHKRYQKTSQMILSIPINYLQITLQSDIDHIALAMLIRNSALHDILYLGTFYIL